MMKRWTIYIVGNDSGSETELSFMRCFRREKAQQWLDMLNEHRGAGLPLIRYEVRRIGESRLLQTYRNDPSRVFWESKRSFD